MATLTYNGSSFNIEWASALSVEEFIKHEKHGELSKEDLTEAHKLIRAQKATAKREQLKEIPSVVVDEEGKVQPLQSEGASDAPGDIPSISIPAGNGSTKKR